METIIIVIGVLIGIAYNTLTERKVMGVMQRRVGPNTIGIWGLLQPMSDGLKLVVKESITPISVNKLLYYIGPIGMLYISLIIWLYIPYGEGVKNNNIDIWYILGISSITIVFVIISGYGSNSKYSLLGGIRATAQMISYEVVIGIVILGPMMGLNEGPTIRKIVEMQGEVGMNGVTYWPLLVIFVISIIAETGRVPFDLLEAESELVSGFFTEYSSLYFAYFFLAEYGNIIFMSLLTLNLFLGGHLLYLPLIISIFVISRATLVRYRYTDLINICWMDILPITMGYLTIIAD